MQLRLGCYRKVSSILPNNCSKSYFSPRFHREKSGDNQEPQNHQPSSSKFRFFHSSSSSSNQQHQQNNANNSNNSNGQPAPAPKNGILKSTSYDQDTLSRVGQRLAASNQTPLPPPPTSPSSGYRHNQQPPQPLPKPQAWRMRNGHHNDDDEVVLPNDSFYGTNSNGQQQPQSQQTRSGVMNGNLAHWPSHGYLSKPTTTTADVINGPGLSPGSNGYVVLRRPPGGDHMMNMQRHQSQQPQSLPITARPANHGPGELSFGGDPERKYFSVRGFSDLKQRSQPDSANVDQHANKYYSVDARYNSVKNHLHLPPDLKMKLRQLQTKQHQAGQPGGNDQVPPAPPPRPGTMAKQSEMERSKAMSGSNQWLEWTQQLQAYVAWVNSQLRKRPDLKPVVDLRTDLQSGEVLAQLIEIICK